MIRAFYTKTFSVLTKHRAYFLPYILALLKDKTPKKQKRYQTT